MQLFKWFKKLCFLKMYHTYLLLMYFVSLFMFRLGFSEDKNESSITQVAKPSQFPYHASLRTKNAHFCSGSIISSKHILTSAHCVKDIKWLDLIVQVGDNNADAGDIFAVKHIKIHPDFDKMFYADVAVVTLIDSILFNRNIKKISLDFDVLPPGMKTVRTGWSKFTLPNSLLYFNLTTIPLGKCVDTYGHVINDVHLCTSPIQDLTYCSLDTGSALVSSESSDQIGIATWGLYCTTTHPHLFTSVASYKDFIISVMNNY